jgi:hypothetical protein
MHYAVLNRATVRVADTRDIIGRLTADSINDGARAETKSSLWRACGLTIFCSVISVGVLASLTPVPALADEEEGGVRKEIAALKKQVAALQSQVQTLQTQLAAVQSNKALELGPFVSVDPNRKNGVIGPHITFTGANIHIESGSGATDDHLSTGGSLTGRGNLIIGYDEDPAALGSPLNPGDRGGSHNLVIGRWNRFGQFAFGGLVAGEANSIMFEAASVSGGQFNSAYYIADSVSGGQANDAIGENCSVSGGQYNVSGSYASSVIGGVTNTASGGSATVCGGGGNTAGGYEAVVIGGLNITDNNDNSIAPGAPLNYP